MVQVQDDPIYGTPVFTTIGGQSKCPGETATARRNSNVNIREIKHQCGPDSNSICDATTLKAGDLANFIVVIYNDSPTGTQHTLNKFYISLPIHRLKIIFQYLFQRKKSFLILWSWMQRLTRKVIVEKKGEYLVYTHGFPPQKFLVSHIAAILKFHL